jgi:hypothetical protein
MTPDIIKHGEKIDRPGLYAMRMSWYHDDCCVGPSISSTGLRTIIHCPAKYWASSIYNPDGRPMKSSSGFAFGKAAHSLTLEGVLPRREFAVHAFSDFNTNEGRVGPYGRHKNYRDYKAAWKKRAEALGMTVLSGEDLRTIAEIYQALERHPFVQAGGLDGMVEMSMIWQDKETGIWLKSRPDVLPLNDAYADTKFVVDASQMATSRSMANYRYDMQAALVGEGMEKVLGRIMQNAVLFCVEKEFPYIAEDWEFNDRYIACGRADNHTALRIFRDCLDSGVWPTYTRNTETLGPPDWLEQRATGGKRADLGTLEELQ